jgi:hypothetical protein
VHQALAFLVVTADVLFEVHRRGGDAGLRTQVSLREAVGAPHQLPSSMSSASFDE